MSWQDRRKVRLEIDRGLCGNCGLPAGQAHHIVPKALGGSDRITNLVSLCEACHSIVTGINLVGHSVLTKRAMDEAKRQGRWMGKKPAGYTIDRSGKLALTKEGKEVAELLRQNPNLSAVAVQRNIGCANYKAAWNLLNSIRKIEAVDTMPIRPQSA